MAQGGLRITPRRVIFDGTKNTQQLNLANTGQDTASFAVSFIQYRMKENGSFEQITEADSGQYFADNYLRMYPRSVTLGPGEAQLIKVQLKNYRKLDNGEYRSHIYFRSITNTKPWGEEDKQVDTTSLSVRLTPIFGISIPAIIRKGKSDTEVVLTDLSVSMLNDTTPVLNIKLNRSGNMSVYGDIEVDYVSGDSKTTQAGLVRGLAVYTPNTVRYFQLKLDNGIDYNKGKLHIVYKTKSDLKMKTLAEEKLILQN